MQCGEKGLKGNYAGLATSDLRSEVPITYMDEGRGASYRSIKSYYQRPKSHKILKWKMLLLQSNCNMQLSGRSYVIEKLMERNLIVATTMLIFPMLASPPQTSTSSAAVADASPT